jgi:hypothetical protein
MMFNYKIPSLYPNEGIGFLVGLVGLSNIPPLVKRCVMEPIEFLGFLKRGTSCLVNLFKHEQYPSNGPDQNNSAHGVTM